MSNGLSPEHNINLTVIKLNKLECSLLDISALVDRNNYYKIDDIYRYTTGHAINSCGIVVWINNEGPAYWLSCEEETTQIINNADKSPEIISTCNPIKRIDKRGPCFCLNTMHYNFLFRDTISNITLDIVSCLLHPCKPKLIYSTNYTSRSTVFYMNCTSWFYLNIIIIIILFLVSLLPFRYSAILASDVFLDTELFLVVWRKLFAFLGKPFCDEEGLYWGPGPYCYLLRESISVSTMRLSPSLTPSPRGYALVWCAEWDAFEWVPPRYRK